METEDPRVALSAPDVKTRAAGARDLAAIGTWVDVERLVEIARADKSTAVRMLSASAAVDIVWRRRGAFGQRGLDLPEREQLQDVLKRVDPGEQPGLLPLFAALASDDAIARLGRILRDPRNQARVGAIAAVRRMALSGASAPSLEAAALGWLGQKLPTDVSIELVKLVGEAGWASCAGAMADARGHGPTHGEAVDEALARLRTREVEASWEGLWVDEGVDVVELNLEPRSSAWQVVVGATCTRLGEARPVAWVGGNATVGGEPARIVFAPRLGSGDQRFMAIQVGGRTWWRRDRKDLAAWVDEVASDVGAVESVALRAVAGWLDGSELLAAVRARAVARILGGAPADALVDLDALTGGEKKPKPDVWWWLAQARAAVGDRGGAVAALDEFLDRAPKRADERKDAEAMRARLAG